MMTTRRQNSVFLALVVAAGAAIAAAQQPVVRRGTPQFHGNAWEEQIECQIPVKQGERLVLRANPGSVNVSPGSDNQVQCVVVLESYGRNPERARTCLESYRLEAERTADGALIEGEPQCGRGAGSIGARFDVAVPLVFNLDIKTLGGNVTVERSDGSLRTETAGGDIRTGDVIGPVSVKTAGGMIDLGNIRKSVEARSAGGNIQVGNVNGSATLETNGGMIVAGVVNGPMTAQTMGGDIVLQAASGPVTVETAGGQIRLGECGNTVRAQTAGGNIQVGGSRGVVTAETSGGNITLLRAMGPVTAQTSAGRILAQIAATRQTFGPSRLDTQVGDVDVFLPPTLPVTINALVNHTTMGRRIFSDFPLSGPVATKTLAFGPERAEVRLQGGGTPLEIRTTMGSIQIRQIDAESIARLKALQDAFWKNWSEIPWQSNETVRQMREIQRAMEQQRHALQQQLEELNRELRERVREQVEQMGGPNQ